MGFKSLFKDLYSVKSISANDVHNYFGNGRKKIAGVNVSPSTAIQLSTVYSCIRDKAESIGQLPIKLYRKGANFDTEVKTGRWHRIFCEKPNDYMTSQDLSEMIETCLEMYGRFFAYRLKNDRGETMEIIPFARQTSVAVNMDMNGNIYFTYTTNDGKPKMGFYSDEIVHLKLNTLNGYTGLSPISCNARAIGLSISQENHLVNTMEKGAMPSGILETDAQFKDSSAAERIRKEFQEKYQGVDKNGEVIFLENGLKYNPLTLSPADTELILQRQHSREEICGIFRVPPHRIGAASSTKNQDIEQANKDYYVNKLMPIVTKIETGLSALLPDNMYVKLDEKAFTRGDLTSQVDAYSELFKHTAINIDELRYGAAGLPPIDNGHLHAIDTNNITLGTLDQVEELQREQREMNARSQQTINQPVGDENDE